MRSDGEATRRRILEAARAEFAQHGLAGARVDRIAATASASKERLYAYFGDKANLFREVLDRNRREVIEAVPVDVADLPGFVGRIFDHTVSNPDHLRMLDWARLEGVTAPAAVDEDQAGLVVPEAEIRRAQADGRIDDGWDAADLMAMLFALALTWANTPGILSWAGGAGEELRVQRRASLVRAAARLVEPATG